MLAATKIGDRGEVRTALRGVADTREARSQL